MEMECRESLYNINIRFMKRVIFMTMIELLILGLASFRLTRLIVADMILEWMRRPFLTIHVVTDEHGTEEEWLEPRGWIGKGITCQWCVGVWSSLIILGLYMYLPYGDFVIYVFAIAGLQSMFYEWSEGRL